jgi:hypothetical protein
VKRRINQKEKAEKMNVGIRVGKEWIELDDILPGVVPSQLVITCDLDPYRRRLFKASALAQFYGRKSCSQLARKVCLLFGEF